MARYGSHTVTIDMVESILVDRLATGFYPPGSRLPSCRTLADELGSNPNTVSRVLQHLSDLGAVRTIPRRGTYAADDVAELSDMPNPRAHISDRMARLVWDATMLGLDGTQVASILHEELDRVVGVRPRVVFAECNAGDLHQMGGELSHSTGVEVEPYLITDLEDVLSKGGDLMVAVPLYHLAEVKELTSDRAPVIAVNYIPDPGDLEEIASLEPDSRVLVLSRLERSGTRLASMVGQYFGGQITAHLVVESEPEDEAHLVDLIEVHDVVVYNNAACLDDDWVVRHAPRVIKLEYVLQASSASRFRTLVSQQAATLLPVATA